MQQLQAGKWRRATACLTVVAAVALLAPAANAAPPLLWETNGSVSAIAEREDTMYIGGSFSYVGPHTGYGVALSMESGAVDPAFPQVEGGGCWPR
jgi:hypothetical protein